ncbi:MAG: AAA family ATPase [Acidimicrobiales bacterium]
MSAVPGMGPSVAGRVDADEAGRLFARTVDAVAEIVLTDRVVVELAVVAVMVEGHLLIEDRPGLGKTTLAKTLAAATSLDCRRVQCTADLLPADVTGALVFDAKSGMPVFRPGPIFTNIVLADELNRASARSQSAFLEAMGEHQVTVDGVTHDLPRPFVVIATQNPFDDVGTTTLPHGQRDRFLLRLSLGYPTRADERELLIHGDRSALVAEIPSIGFDNLMRLRAAADAVHVSSEVAAYVLELLEATRRHESVLVGASPRAGLAVLRSASGLAAGRGRDYVAPDDVQMVAVPALAHRLLLTPEAALYGIEPSVVVEEVLNVVPVVSADAALAD